MSKPVVSVVHAIESIHCDLWWLILSLHTLIDRSTQIPQDDDGAAAAGTSSGPSSSRHDDGGFKGKGKGNC